MAQNSHLANCNLVSLTQTSQPNLRISPRTAIVAPRRRQLLTRHGCAGDSEQYKDVGTRRDEPLPTRTIINSVSRGLVPSLNRAHYRPYNKETDIREFLFRIGQLQLVANKLRLDSTSPQQRHGATCKKLDLTGNTCQSINFP